MCNDTMKKKASPAHQSRGAFPSVAPVSSPGAKSNPLVSGSEILPRITTEILKQQDLLRGSKYDKKVDVGEEHVHKSQPAGFFWHSRALSRSSKNPAFSELDVEEHKRDESTWTSPGSKNMPVHLLTCHKPVFFKPSELLDPLLASKEQRRMLKWIQGKRDTSLNPDNNIQGMRSRSCPPMEFESSGSSMKRGIFLDDFPNTLHRVKSRNSTIGLGASIHHSIEALRRAAENLPVILKAVDLPPLTPLMDERVMAERLFKGLSALDSALLAGSRLHKSQESTSPKSPKNVMSPENVQTTTQLATSAMIRAHAASLDKNATSTVEASVNAFCEQGDMRLIDVRNISKNSIQIFDQRLGGLRKLKGEFDVISVKNDSVQQSAARLGAEMQRIEAFLRSGLEERVRKVLDMPQIQQLRQLNLITYESNKRRTILAELFDEVNALKKLNAIKSESVAQKAAFMSEQLQDPERKLSNLLAREQNEETLSEAEVREIKTLKETISNLYNSYKKDAEIGQLEELITRLANLFVEIEKLACQEEEFARRALQEHEAGAQYRAELHKQESLDDMKKKISWLIQENPTDIAHGAAKNMTLILQKILEEPDVPEHRRINAQSRVSLIPKILDAKFGQDVLFSIGFFLYASKGCWILPSEISLDHCRAALNFFHAELESQLTHDETLLQRKFKRRSILSVAGVHKRGSISVSNGPGTTMQLGDLCAVFHSPTSKNLDVQSAPINFFADGSGMVKHRKALSELFEALEKQQNQLEKQQTEHLTLYTLKKYIHGLVNRLPADVASKIIQTFVSFGRKGASEFISALRQLLNSFPEPEPFSVEMDREKEQKMKKLVSRWWNEHAFDCMRSWKYYAEKRHEERDRILGSYGSLCDRLNIPGLAAMPLTQILHSHKHADFDISGRGISSVGVKALLCAMYGRAPDFHKSVSDDNIRDIDRFDSIRAEDLFVFKLEHADLFRMRANMSFSPITRLILKENDLKASGAQALVQMLKGCEVDLEELNMESNNIGENGGMAIAALLSCVPSRPVRHLFLGRNKMGDAGTASILQALANSVQIRQSSTAADYLKHLDLSHNEAADLTAIQAGNVFSEAKIHLEYLDLSWNLIRNDSAAVLFEGLRGNKNLRMLNLEWNGLGSSKCCLQIGEALATCALHTLNLSRCRITAAGTSLISNGLVKNRDLQLLIMDGNSIMQTGAKTLFKAKIDSNRGDGAQLIVSTNDCNIEVKDASCFDASEPGGMYSLDMKMVHNRQVLLELMRLVSRGTGRFMPSPPPEIDEAYDGDFKPYKKLVVEGNVEEDWWIPESGNLRFSFGNSRMVASLDQSMATSDREWNAIGDEIFDPETSSKQWISIIRAQISGDTFLRFDQVAGLFNRIDQNMPSGIDKTVVSSLRIEIVKHCYNRLVDPDRSLDLLDLLTAQERPIVEKYLGFAAKNFTQNNPSGFYNLNLAAKAEREVLIRLIEIYNTQYDFWNKSKPWYSTRAGGVRPEIDICWRNARHDGHPHIFSTAWAVPTSGIYQVDFVQIIKPSPQSQVPNEEDFATLMRETEEIHSQTEKLTKIRRWSNSNLFMCEHVDQLLDLFHDESSRVELFVLAFARTLDWHGFTNLLPLLSPSEMKLLRYRVSMVNLFDDVSAVGFYELDLAIPEDRFVAQELVHLAILEPGDNIKDCQYNGVDMVITGGWAKSIPVKGLLSLYYCREKECILEVAAKGAWKQEGHPHCVDGVIPTLHRSDYRSCFVANKCEAGLIQPAGTFWIRDHKLRSIILKMKNVAATADEMFKLLDRDGGGSLDSRELAAGLFRLGVWLHPNELQALVQVLDSDGGGTVCIDEFRAVWAGADLKIK